MLDAGPSQLYDALAKILGLDDLVDAQDALQKERNSRDKGCSRPRTRNGRELLRELPEGSSDARVIAARRALERKDDWGLDELEALVAGSTHGEPTPSSIS